MTAVKMTGMAFLYASTDLQENLHVVMAAVKADSEVIRHVPLWLYSKYRMYAGTKSLITLLKRHKETRELGKQWIVEAQRESFELSPPENHKTRTLANM